MHVSFTKAQPLCSAPPTPTAPLLAGGTVANCFSAACRKGAPTSQFLPEGAPVYNATCYCPYVTTRQPFLMSSADYPCGPATASQVKPSTLIYNGGWVQSLDNGMGPRRPHVPGHAYPLLLRKLCSQQDISPACLRPHANHGWHCHCCCINAGL